MGCLLYTSGAIAGEMAENDKIVYIADYPILGTIAQINAFALGAQMTNPRAKVYLEWSTLIDQDIEKRIDEIDPNCISGKDIIVPDDNNHFYGVYHRESGGGEQKNLAMPLCHWGKFYEELIRIIMAGNWEQDNDVEKAINYWWGMPTGVVDVCLLYTSTEHLVLSCCSEYSLQNQVLRLLQLLIALSLLPLALSS